MSRVARPLCELWIYGSSHRRGTRAARPPLVRGLLFFMLFLVPLPSRLILPSPVVSLFVGTPQERIAAMDKDAEEKSSAKIAGEHSDAGLYI